MYQNPYHALTGGRWYKANFHTHGGTGAGTCGETPLSAVLTAYAQSGFDVLCISNHDEFTDTAALCSADLRLIPGVEYSRGGHMLTIGVARSLHTLSHQHAIDAAAQAGGFTVLCHPNWQEEKHWPIAEMLKLQGFLGIEVINMLIYRLSGSGLAADVWDALLSAGRRVYGFGNDDMHRIFDVGRSFNYVYCAQNTKEAVLAAVLAGRFCASTGLVPQYLRLEDDTLCVKAAYPAPGYVDDFVYRFIGPEGRVLAQQRGSAARYTLRGEAYVRVEVQGENGALLFFQPIWAHNG